MPKTRTRVQKEDIEIGLWVGEYIPIPALSFTHVLEALHFRNTGHQFMSRPEDNGL